MPQDIEAESELRNLAAVPYQIISPANNSPIIGIFQDSLLGCNRFTREGIAFDARHAMNLLMMFNRVNENELQALLEQDKPITNFDLLTQIMSPISLKYKTKLFKDDEEEKSSNNVLEIRDGKYIRGQLEKSTLGGGTKGLLQRICNDYGNRACADFIDNLQNIITEYMKTSSYSVGISDLIAPKSVNQKIIEVITEKKKEVKNIIDQTLLGVFENKTGRSNQEEFETQVNNILNQASAEVGKVGLKSLGKDNRFVTMVNAGSKGSDLNISFMISCLGQQNVDGKRIPYGFDHRTLPHFTKYDDSPGARGFVESSYINGLSPQELFFHAMGGRVGLIDTAVKTSSTGYIQRRLIKGLEDLMVSYDMTVRTNKNKIVQFTYGDDGIDPVKVENQMCPIVTMGIQDIYAHFQLPGDKENTKLLSAIFLKPVLTRHKKQLPQWQTRCKEITDLILSNRDKMVKNIFKNKGDIVVNSPVAFAYIIGNIQGQQNLTLNSMVDLTLWEAMQMIDVTYSNLEKIRCAVPTELFKTLYYYYLAPKELLIVKRFHRAALTILLETIVVAYKRSIVAPGEMVGMIAAQSIGEPTTQLTLNSFTYETELLVRDRQGIIQTVQIGDFVEKYITTPKRIEYYADKDTTYAELGDYYEIQSCTENGEILWKEIEAVTRHPVINEDGSNTMLKVTTNEEREVNATKAKSFLKLVDGKIVPVTGSSLKVGDYVPVSTKQLDYKETRELDLRSILPPTEYIYSTEIDKAKAVMHEHHWWSKHSGSTFVLPYRRSDSFVSRVNDKIRNNSKSKGVFQPGCVYMLQNAMNFCTIPEKIPLDYDFGYLLGAYAAEGCMTKFQCSISNNDTAYFEPIVRLCQRWNITTKVFRHENKCQEGWTSQDIRLYCTLLCRILDKLCGKLSHNKFVHDSIVFSNRECILGFLDAYIGGDGCVDKKGKQISMSSVSKRMLIDVQVMLNTLGIYSFIKSYKKQESNNRGTKPENIHQMYILFVTNKQAQHLAKMLNMRIEYKKESLQLLIDHSYIFQISKKYLTIPNEIDGVICWEDRTDGLYEDVLFDCIKSIEEIPNTTKYAYDVTVKDTKTFVTKNGLNLEDTFHFSGVSSKSNVTRGVPRIEEILSLSSEPKNPSLTVYLKQEEETEREKAQEIMYMLEHTKMGELVSSTEICFDPDDLNTLIAEDAATMEQYRAFESMMDECLNQVDQDTNEKSKWVLRMEMNPEMMLEKNISMDDVHFTIQNSYGDDISCVYTDYNADKLVFRIRMSSVLKPNAKGQQAKKAKVNSLDQSDQVYLLKNFQDQLLENIVIRGIKNIGKVVLRKIKDNVTEINGVYKKQDIWVLDTIGTNLLDILALEFIDTNRTFSNDIVEIYEVLGIEAARQTIQNELAEVIEFDGTYINYHHLSVLCDRMTFTNKMISIFRHGINNDNIGPIAKASFEETPEMFLKAARHAELDTMRGVSANVMCGQEGLFGTNAFQVVLDLDEMRKLEEVILDEQSTLEASIEKQFGDIENPDDPCSTNRLIIQNNVAAVKTKDLGQDTDYTLDF